MFDSFFRGKEKPERKIAQRYYNDNSLSVQDHGAIYSLDNRENLQHLRSCP